MSILINLFFFRILIKQDNSLYLIISLNNKDYRMKQILYALFIINLAYSATLSFYICPQGYFFDAQHCQACQTNCICSSMGACTSCVAGYTMYQGSCIQCPQSSGIYGACSSCCSKTTGTQLSCTDCLKVTNSYSFLYSGRCITSPGCFEIDSYGFCTECFNGFYEINNLCYSCHTSCSTCSDSTNCLTCADGYYWGVSNGGLCANCPSGCATCDSSGLCASCLAYYYLFSTHCLNCPPNCNYCTDGSTCTSCSAGILVSNLCILCTDTTYGGSAGCTTCYNDNNFISCTQCQDTYYLDSNGACQLCSSSITGAIRCRDQNTPTQCQNDYSPTLNLRYYLVGITCILNAKNCRKISDIYGNCSQCYSAYALVAGSCNLCPFTGCLSTLASVFSNVCTCTGCSSGYYLSGVNCLTCSTADCDICASNTCSQCKAGFHFNLGTCVSNALTNCKISSTSSACTACAIGYYKGSDNLCYNCQLNCLECIARFDCQKCSNNYFLNTTSKSCVLMPSNCVSLDASHVCILCSYGYYLNNGYCSSCQVELGTLNKCSGLCPIDFYISSLVVSLSEMTTYAYILLALLFSGLIFP